MVLGESKVRQWEIPGNFLRLAWSGLESLLWESDCFVCGREVAESGCLCEICWRELLKCCGGDYCPGCGVDISRYGVVGGRCPRCPEKGFAFDRIARAGVYDEALRNMILSFKTADKTEFVSVLRPLMEAAFTGMFAGEKIDCFVPVPIHWQRKLTRGFNQSYLLIKKSKLFEDRINTDLVRIRKTRIQPGLSTQNRIRNVHGAFAVRSGHDFKGKTICLVDDVKTTGATLNECAKILKVAGAKRVLGLVTAVAGQDKDPGWFQEDF